MSLTIQKKKKPVLFQGQGQVYMIEGGKKIVIGNVSSLKITPAPAKNKVVMGIDVSTATGIVVLQYDPEHKVWRTKDDFEINLPPLPKTATMVQRMERCWFLADALGDALTEFRPDLVAVEGYGYANAYSLVTLVEFGTAVRMALTSYDEVKIKLLEVAPASLKKFILGKGVGKKEQVMMQVFKKWGYEAKTNNLADAYVLAQIAVATVDSGIALSKPQIEVLKVVEAKNA